MPNKRDILIDRTALLTARREAAREAARRSVAERMKMGVFQMNNGTIKVYADSSRHMVPGSRVELYAGGQRIDD